MEHGTPQIDVVTLSKWPNVEHLRGNRGLEYPPLIHQGRTSSPLERPPDLLSAASDDPLHTLHSRLTLSIANCAAPSTRSHALTQHRDLMPRRRSLGNTKKNLTKQNIKSCPWHETAPPAPKTRAVSLHILAARPGAMLAWPTLVSEQAEESTC